MSEKFRLDRKIGFQNTFYTKCINVIIDSIGPSIILRSIYWKSRRVRSCVKLRPTGVISKPPVLEQVHKRKIAYHAYSQLLLLQMITLKLDYELYGFANNKIMLCTAAE